MCVRCCHDTLLCNSGNTVVFFKSQIQESSKGQRTFFNFFRILPIRIDRIWIHNFCIDSPVSNALHAALIPLMSMNGGDGCHHRIADIELHTSALHTKVHTVLRTLLQILVRMYSIAHSSATKTHTTTWIVDSCIIIGAPVCTCLCVRSTDNDGDDGDDDECALTSVREQAC